MLERFDAKTAYSHFEKNFDQELKRYFHAFSKMSYEFKNITILDPATNFYNFALEIFITLENGATTSMFCHGSYDEGQTIIMEISDPQNSSEVQKRIKEYKLENFVDSETE